MALRRFSRSASSASASAIVITPLWWPVLTFGPSGGRVGEEIEGEAVVGAVDPVLKGQVELEQGVRAGGASRPRASAKPDIARPRQVRDDAVVAAPPAVDFR